MNPGEFDYYSWERQQRVLATMLVSHADGVQIDSDPGPGAIVWMREKARHLLAQGFTLDRSYDHVLLRAFVLGDSDPQLEDLEEQFVNTGIVHFLSVSGLHVAIAGGFVLFLGRVLRASPRASLIAALIGVALYGIVATPTWPGWRSILMFGAFGAGVMFRRRPDSIQLFAAAVGAILLIHPGDISNGGFQISFAAVLGMMFFTTRAMKWAQAKWRGPDAVALRPPRRGTWREGLVWVGRFFVSALFASSIAWLMVIPLIAYHYGQLNTYSALAGVVFLPVTVLALIFGLGKIVLTFCWPGLAHFWAVGCVIPVVWLRDMAAGLAKIPGATIPLPTPSVGLLVVYYALVLVALFRWKSWVRRAAPVAAVGLLFLWPLVAGRASSSRGEIRITLISLGNGQCAVVRAADGHAVLIDCGSSTVADLRRRLITPYLRAEGCSKVDEVFLSHAAFDRLSGAGDVFANYDEPAFFTNPQFAREAMGDVPGEELLEKLLDADRMPRILHRGDRLQLADGVTVDVLWPPADCGLNSNNCSLVLKLGYAGRSVIFPGDVQDAAQRELLANPHELKCDVLVAPYHGSAGTTTARFLRAAGAQMILASNSSKPTHKEKIFDSMAGDAAVYRTSRCGAITVTIGAGGRISVETFISGR
jgi:competence protein ComEC